jgi:hypothetical protein
MSLRNVPGGKLHSVIETVALVLTVGVWAVYGFPHVMEFVAFGGLVIICIGIPQVDGVSTLVN